ncbi:MAG: enoyl-CoA hydratase/isomerase family protein [Chlorobi bacterium]|nr:enoyl-CoA hydratase/isomerase family protein [Chlorobiota bacterium]
MNSRPKIVLKREGETGVILLNNPPENYIEQPGFIDIEELQKFVGNGIKALVIGGAGRHFSAGAGREAMKESIKDINRFHTQLIEGNRLLNYIDELDIPVIAAISGVCFGAGLEIALACDIRICEENSLFAFPEINHKLFPGLGGTQRLAELTGKATAMELVLGGDMIAASKAKELGIIDEVIPKRKAIEHAVNMAGKLTENRPLKVINAVMQSISNYEKLTVEEAMKKEADMFAKLAQKAFEIEEPDDD